MYNNCCETNQIHQLNEQKEYVLLAQKILETVLTDDRLTNAAGKLWSFLYGKAKFDKALMVQVEQRALAIQFNKHPRTIARYIAELHELGYLKVFSHFGDQGQRLANSYQLTLPSHVLDNVQKTKDRKLAQDETQVEVPAPSSLPHDKPVSPPHDKTVITNNNIINITKTNNKTCLSPKTKENLTCMAVVEFNKNEKKEETIQPNATTVSLSNKPKSHNSNEKSVFHVKQFQDDLPPKQTVQPDVQKKQRTLENNIQKAKQNVARLTAAYKSFQQDYTQPDAQQVFQELLHHEACLEQFQLQHDCLLRQIQAQQQTQAIDGQLKQDPEFIVKTDGDRRLSGFEIARLKKGLKTLCGPERLPRLLNEITFAIRFGGLRQQQGTQKLLSIPHSISIALKLVREGRWETPSQLQDFLQTLAKNN